MASERTTEHSSLSSRIILSSALIPNVWTGNAVDLTYLFDVGKNSLLL